MTLGEALEAVRWAMWQLSCPSPKWPREDLQQLWEEASHRAAVLTLPLKTRVRLPHRPGKVGTVVVHGKGHAVLVRWDTAGQVATWFEQPSWHSYANLEKIDE